MPKVGDKHFSYSKEGIKKAEAYAEVTGEELIPTYDAGDRVEQYQLGGEVEMTDKPFSYEKPGVQGDMSQAQSNIQAPEQDLMMQDIAITPDAEAGYKKGGKVKKNKKG